VPREQRAKSKERGGEGQRGGHKLALVRWLLPIPERRFGKREKEKERKSITLAWARESGPSCVCFVWSARGEGAGSRGKLSLSLVGK